MGLWSWNSGIISPVIYGVMVMELRYNLTCHIWGYGHGTQVKSHLSYMGLWSWNSGIISPVIYGVMVMELRYNLTCHIWGYGHGTQV